MKKNAKKNSPIKYMVGFLFLFAIQLIMAMPHPTSVTDIPCELEIDDEYELSTDPLIDFVQYISDEGIGFTTQSMFDLTIPGEVAGLSVVATKISSGFLSNGPQFKESFGSAIIQMPDIADESMKFDFSVPIKDFTLVLADFTNDERMTVNAYDENNTLLTLSVSGVQDLGNNTIGANSFGSAQADVTWGAGQTVKRIEFVTAVNNSGSTNSFRVEINGGSAVFPSVVYTWNGTSWVNNAPEGNSTSIDDMLIQAGNAAVISSAIDINDVTIESGATLSLSGDVNTVGDLSNNGTIDGSSTVIMNGAAAQDISGTGTIANLTVDNSNGLAFSGAQELTGTLTATDGAITTNSNLTFNSDMNGTAVLAPLGTGASITGNVNVERYIPAGNRAFRFLGSTVGGVSVFDSWQEAANNAAGFGTHVTGTIGTVGTNNESNGHDETASGTPSMLKWNETSQGWNIVANTKNETLTPGTFYRVLVRGDRTTDLSSNASPHTTTTLRATGELKTGNFTVDPSVTSGQYFTAANPYQAKLDMGSVAISDVISDMYYWDPNLGTEGGYSAINISSGIGTAGAATNVLDPGQGVLFQASANNASIVINETDKVSGTSNLAVFSTPNLLRVKLYQTARFQAGQSESDGMYIHFDSQFNDAIDGDDTPKLDGLNANIAIIKPNGNRYAVERRTIPSVDELLQLDITNYQVNDYTLVVNLGTLPGVNVLVKDNFTGTQTPINQGGQTLISYSIDSNNGLTTAANRFELVFQMVTLGLDDNDSLTATVSVYPNPVSDNDALTISLGKSLTETATVNVYNTLGQQVITRLFESNSNGILNLAEVNDLSNGVYIVTIETGEEKAVRRFIKQ